MLSYYTNSPDMNSDFGHKNDVTAVIKRFLSPKNEPLTPSLRLTFFPEVLAVEGCFGYNERCHIFHLYV